MFFLVIQCKSTALFQEKKLYVFFFNCERTVFWKKGIVSYNKKKGSPKLSQKVVSQFRKSRKEAVLSFFMTSFIKLMILDLPTVENLCINTCFGVVFLTTIYYWFQTILTPNLFLFSTEKGPKAQNGELPYKQTGLFGYICAIFCLTFHLLVRWVDSGHFPLSNLYESLLFLAWCLMILQVFVETSMKTLFLGVLTSPAVLCLIAFTDFSLPPELQKSSPLVPALQSNWLVMHVTVMIASYAALLVGCLVAIAYLIFSSFLPKFSLKKEKFRTTLKVVTLLDNVSYRTIGIGFCFLTLGILSGAVWANETWGNYWSWDPKETWAFITWLTFASYLHSRLIGGWTGSKPAWIATFGFIIVWICYLGVNLLGQGLHSYGFLQN